MRALIAGTAGIAERDAPTGPAGRWSGAPTDAEHGCGSGLPSIKEAERNRHAVMAWAGDEAAARAKGEADFGKLEVSALPDQ